MSEDLKVFGKTYSGVTGIQVRGTSGKDIIFEKEEPESLDVDFIDYDGTLVYSYTAENFLAMSEMPPNPSHKGLIAQGWNWTLEDAKEIVSECGFHVIGQNYTTDDGATRIYLNLNEYDTLLPQYINTYVYANTSFTVNWGDGTSEETNQPNNASIGFTHNYSEKKDYIITISNVEGSGYILGYWGAHSGIAFANSGDGTMSKDSVKRVTKIEIGNGCVGLGSQPFALLSNLKSVSIPITCCGHEDSIAPRFCDTENMLKGIVLPNGFTKYGSNSVNSKLALKYISFPKSLVNISTGLTPINVEKLVFPNGITSMPRYSIRQPLQLKRLHLPNGVTEYPANSLYEVAQSMDELTIPSTVTSIGENCFPIPMIRVLRLKPTTPPTLANTNAFQKLTKSIIYVPYSEDHSILEAYQTATNWSTWASQMQEEAPQ